MLEYKDKLMLTKKQTRKLKRMKITGKPRMKQTGCLEGMSHRGHVCGMGRPGMVA